MHWILSYDIAPDYLERRGTYRAEHLALARAALERGDLVLGGALGDPVEASMLLFKGETPAQAEAFAHADPYVASGIVTRWRVLPWHTVVGVDAQVAVN